MMFLEVQQNGRCEMFEHDVARAKRQYPDFFSEPAEVSAVLEGLSTGSNILLHHEKSLSLCKFAAYETEFLSGMNVRYGPWLVPAFSILDPKPNPIKVRKLWNLSCSHRLDFVYDEEFDFFMPSAGGCFSPISIEVSTLDVSGAIAPQKAPVSVVVESEKIEEQLRAITTPYFFRHAVEPFLESRLTHFEVPCGRRFKPLPSMQMDFAKATKKLSHGDFVYVGSKEEVYLMSLTREYNGGVYYQGTYLASTKPPLFFTNSYLDHHSPSDMRKPLFRGEGLCNVARYRGSDPPAFEGKPFICPHIGRKQWCKYTVFTGTPDVITGDLSEALMHFKGTDFADQIALVKDYAANIQRRSPEAYPRTGRFYI